MSQARAVDVITGTDYDNLIGAAIMMIKSFNDLGTPLKALLEKVWKILPTSTKITSVAVEQP